MEGKGGGALIDMAAMLRQVAARMKLEKSMTNRESLENDNRKLRDELQRQAGEQVGSCIDQECHTLLLLAFPQASVSMLPRPRDAQLV